MFALGQVKKKKKNLCFASEFLKKDRGGSGAFFFLLKCTPNSKLFFKSKLKGRCLSTKVGYDNLLFLLRLQLQLRFT